MFKDFTSETDFHGCKFFCLPGESLFRRFVYILFWLASLAGFVYFCYLRFSYFPTFPYSSTSTTDVQSAPLPAIAICPYRDFFQAKPLAWVDNDIDFIFHIHLRVGDPLSFLDVNRDSGLASINASQLREQKVNNNIFISREDLDRLDEIPTDLTFYYKEALLQFYKKFGMSKEFVARWEVGTKTKRRNLQNQVEEVMTDYGYCVVVNSSHALPLKSYIFNDDTGRQVSERVYIEVNTTTTTAACCPGSKLSIIFYDGHYRNMLFTDRYSSRDLGISDGQDYVFNEHAVFDLYYVREENRLSTPYHDTPCSQEREACFRHCHQQRHGCSLIHFASVEQGTNLCPIENHRTKADYKRTIASCEHVCTSSCETLIVKHTQLSERLKKPWQKAGLWEFHVKLGDNSRYETYTEREIYTWDALLAELGGTMGLFLGASILSIVHSIEFTVTKAISSAMARPKKQATRRTR